MIDQAVRAGTLAELQHSGQLLTKVGSVPVVVFWHDDAPYAIEDRCPHLGFPLHQGTVEAGLVTCVVTVTGRREGRTLSTRMMQVGRSNAAGQVAECWWFAEDAYAGDEFFGPATIVLPEQAPVASRA